MTVFHIFTPVVGLLLFGGCATMSKQQTHEIPQENQTSKTIAAANALGDQPSGLKRKVAIGRFSNETRYGQSFFVDQNGERIGKQAMDILSAKLFETGKFILLERSDLDKIEKELALGGNSAIRTSADYLILGSITEFGRKENSEVGLFSRVKKQEVSAKVHIRIVDVTTGEIIYSEEGKGAAFSEAGTVMGVGEKASYDAQLNDKAIDAAISDLASNIIENMLEKPWRGYILGFEEGQYMISGGKSQNIQTGALFEVFTEGKQVKNPQTNMMITLPGRKIATLEVSATLGDTPANEVSLCTLKEGAIDKNSLSSLYIQPKKD